MNKFYFQIIFLLICVIHCHAQEVKNNKNSKITSTIIVAADSTFGYDIFMEGKLMVHQPSRPGMPGNSGFYKRESAQRVAELVMEKIRKGEMPPTVTAEELQRIENIK